METCTRCKRTRELRYMVFRKVYSGKKQWRCRHRSRCSSIAKRSQKK